MMFVLLEVARVGYLVRPEATAQRVTVISGWLTRTVGVSPAGWSAREAPASRAEIAALAG
jgi:hypothetical protein